MFRRVNEPGRSTAEGEDDIVVGSFLRRSCVVLGSSKSRPLKRPLKGSSREEQRVCFSSMVSALQQRMSEKMLACLHTTQAKIILQVPKKCVILQRI